MDVVAITPSVWMLRFEVVNAYVVRIGSGFALIDTGPLGSEGHILGALRAITPEPVLQQVVLTHSHKDHAGSAAALVAETGADVLASREDADVVEGTREEPMAVITAEEQPFYDAIAPLIPAAPPVEVARRLSGGDDLGWDQPTCVVEVPGHTPGSIAIHLPDQRLLFTGDNIAAFGDRAILGPFNVVRSEAIESFRQLANLDIDIACFGHGDPISQNTSARLRSAAALL